MLYRTNFQSRQIEEALRRYGRKYIVVGGFSFYQRAEIKDLLAYLKVAASAAGFHQPAAHDQRAGSRHRQDDHGADRAVRAHERAEHVVRRSSACSRSRHSARAPRQRWRSFSG